MLLPVLHVVLGAAERNFAHERDAEFFNVLAAPDLGVGGLYEVNDAERQCQSEHDGDEEYHLPVRGLRHPAACRRGDYPGIVCSEGLRELILLTFLEEEEVEGLLDFLLTLHRDEVLGLGRIGLDAGGVLSLAGFQGIDPGLDGVDDIVEGDEDGAAHRLESAVQVYYQRVLLAAVGHEAVAAEEVLIELPDEALEG